MDARNDEALLLDYARNADPDAISELVRRHFDSAYRLALHLLRDPGAAEDAAAEAFAARLPRRGDRARRARPPRGEARRAPPRREDPARPPLLRGAHARRGRRDARLSARHGRLADPARPRAAPGLARLARGPRRDRGGA